MNRFVEWLQEHQDVRVTFDWMNNWMDGALRISMQDVVTHKWVSRIEPPENASVFISFIDMLCYILNDLYSKLK